MDYADWKKQRVVCDPQIMAGHPVFSGSRLTVRHLGMRALKEPLAVVQQDYPYLSLEDVEYAKKFTLEGEDYAAKASMEGDVQLLTALLNHSAGFSIDLFGMAHVYRLEDGRFSVTEEDQEERFFPRAREAAEHFLVRRQERRLGFDYSKA